jgi:transposase-like protein
MNQGSRITLGEVFDQAWQGLSEQVVDLVRRQMEQLLEAVRDGRVGRGRHARGAQGLYRSGYRVRKVFDSVLGNVGPLRIPRLRGRQGEVAVLAEQDRRSRGLMEAAVQMALGGLSYRKVRALAGRLWGQWLSGDTLGRLVGQMAQALEARKQAPVSQEEFVGLVLDGVYVQRRGVRGKSVVLVALGVRAEGSFQVLDWEGAEREDTEAYLRLLNRLFERGLEQPRIVVGDGQGGLWAAVEIVYPFARRQECLYHLWGEVRRQGQRQQLPSAQQHRLRRDFWATFDAWDRAEAQGLLQAFLARWRQALGPLAERIAASSPRLLAFFDFDRSWRHRLRTTNLAEGFFRNFRRFLSRFPGVNDLDHAAKVVSMYLIGAETARTRLQQIPQLYFNTIG